MLLSSIRTRTKMEREMCARRALCSLPVELQHRIWTIVMEPPPAPRKPQLSHRLQGFMNRWSDPNRPQIAPRSILF